MNIFISLTLITLLAVFPTISSEASEFPLDALSKIIWEREFRDIGYSYQNKTIAFSQNESALFIAGTFLTSGKGMPTKIEGLWIWKINDAGERVMDVRINNMPDNESKYIDVEALAIMENSDILSVVKLDNGQAMLVKLNSEGKVLFSNKLDKGRHIAKIIPTSDNKFLLIGYQSLDALIIKIDSSN